MMCKQAGAKKKYNFIFSFILCVLNFISIQILAQQSTTISTTKEGISISYKGAERLSGGVPLLEGDQLISGNLVATGDSFTFGTADKSVRVLIKKSVHPEVVGIYLSTHGVKEVKGNEFQGIFFSKFPNYKEGVTFYRYKPWNSWTKPVKVIEPGKLESWDNQCFYWQYHDGTYGVAVPLCDFGYRTTLGSEQGKFGSKALSYVDGFKTNLIPSMAIGFGGNLYTLMANVYESAMGFMGSKENLAKNKKFPEPLEYIGWCTWNASSLGQNLNEATILKGVESFTIKKFPLGWVLIDDGWFDHKNSQLRSFKPDSSKFPNGFSPIIKKLKQDYHLQHIGVWHAFNGYWNGIDATSKLGERYKSELFSWRQKERVDVDDSPMVTYHFIKPTSDSLSAFYSTLHNYLKSEGFSFIKVDNQLSVERMSPGNYPIGNLSKAMHQQLYASVKKYFDNAIINCMDMTADAYYNFGSTAVARSVEDYFPFEDGETYNLQRGNAAAHVLQGIYNNLYFSQMVFPDLDMFQSHNPNGEFHAIARAINNGPIYITDNIGEQNFDLLQKLVLRDGKILRADQALLPTRDCLFQVQDNKLFKGFSKSSGIGLLAVWNCAGANEVNGTVSPSDVENLEGKKIAVYERFSGTLQICDLQTVIPVTLKRMGYKLYYLAPLANGVAPLGLLNKYNAPATIVDYKVSASALRVRIKEGGKFGAVLPSRPNQVLVNGKSINTVTFNNGLCTVDIPQEVQESNKSVEIVIKL